MVPILDLLCRSLTGDLPVIFKLWFLLAGGETLQLCLTSGLLVPQQFACKRDTATAAPRQLHSVSRGCIAEEDLRRVVAGYEHVCNGAWCSFDMSSPLLLHFGALCMHHNIWCLVCFLLLLT